MSVVEIDSNESSRTYILKGQAATAVVAAHADLEAAIADVNARFDAAAQVVLAECGEIEKAVRARHEAEIAAMRADFEKRVAAVRPPYQAEAAAASDAYHAVIYGLVPEMSRTHLPGAVLNYHAVSGVVMITERRDDPEAGAAE